MLVLRHRMGDRCFLEDRVGVGAADPERGNPGAAWLSAGLPWNRLAEEAENALRPVDVGRRPLRMQCSREQAVLHGQDHLDGSGNACGGLGMTDVRLDGTYPERLVRRAALAVGGEQRLSFDGITE